MTHIKDEGLKNGVKRLIDQTQKELDEMKSKAVAAAGK